MTQSLPFKSSLFSTVVSTFPAPYIFDPVTLSEITRVLVPGGRLIILLSAEITGKGIFERFSAFISSIAGEVIHWRPALARPFESSGLSPQASYIDLPGSRILLIQATKPENSNPFL